MIIGDTPILIVIFLFLIFLGPVYAWGLLRFFRYNFQWHLASAIGIMTVVCITSIAWYFRGLPLSPEQVVFDLALSFISAFPWMSYVGQRLHYDRLALHRRINTQAIELGMSRETIKTLEIRTQSQSRERREMLAEIRRLLDENKRSDFEILQQALMLIGLRDEAEKILKTRKN